MSITRRQALTALLGTAGLATLSACSGPAAQQARSASATSAAGPEPVRLGAFNTRNTLTMAIDSGLIQAALTKAGGSATVSPPFPAFAPAAEAMAAGQIDVTTGSTTALVAALQGNPDLAAFAVEVADDDTHGIVATAASGITEASGLSGHRVAVNKGGTGDYLLRMAIVKFGLRNVTPVYLSPPDAASAFASNAVDAWATWDQYLASAQLSGGTVVALAKEVQARNHTVHITTHAFADEQPQLLMACYTALSEQAAKVVADPELLKQAYVASGAPPKVAELVAAKKPPTIRPADALFQAELEAVAKFYHQQGLTPTLSPVGLAAIDVARMR
ncbi:ABC transporter substrate-binding protein [Gephyromycinifex aptenodytis]|uniref:ABC transporter substrate-binding protein n=1 Tax=Gephyromycinifex aptenodytis TaxID=2716227 RepID=UPI0014470130|nr:ABC transporter substrate-binding protein [Gephyromycinifex aptenodytis]